jgi:hypothetical protein
LLALFIIVHFLLGITGRQPRRGDIASLDETSLKTALRIKL